MNEKILCQGYQRRDGTKGIRNKVLIVCELP